jgi:NADH:ubiquinone oxidoreductase subunit 5 (subunit L)/multisubunit Na+/H+ antiporter MnhA subunit
MNRYELSGRVPEAIHSLFIDNLSVIMALIIGIVAPLIMIYTIILDLQEIALH